MLEEVVNSTLPLVWLPPQTWLSPVPAALLVMRVSSRATESSTVSDLPSSRKTLGYRGLGPKMDSTKS